MSDENVLKFADEYRALVNKYEMRIECDDCPEHYLIVISIDGGAVKNLGNVESLGLLFGYRDDAIEEMT